MEWLVKLEAKSGWGEVETIEVERLERGVVGLTVRFGAEPEPTWRDNLMA